MIMQNNKCQFTFSRSPASETTKANLSIFVRNNSMLLDFKHPYLLQSTQETTYLHFFNQESTELLNNPLTIKRLPNVHCLTFTVKKKLSKLITYTKDNLNLYIWQHQNKQKHQKYQEQPVSSIKMDKNQTIIYISQATTYENKDLYMAYTNLDQFYLISVEFWAYEHLLKFQKLNNLDQSKSIIFGWFSKQQEKSQFNSVQLMLVNIGRGEALRLVCFRDNIITVYEVNTSPEKLTIKLIKQKDFPSYISSGHKIRQILSLREKQDKKSEDDDSPQILNLMVSFSKEQSFSIVNTRIQLTVNSVDIKMDKRQISIKADDMSIIKFKDHYFISTYLQANNQSYIHSFKEEELSTLCHQAGTPEKNIMNRSFKLFLSKSINPQTLYVLTLEGLFELTNQPSFKNSKESIKRMHQQKRTQSLRNNNYSQLYSQIQDQYLENKESLNDTRTSDQKKQIIKKMIILFISQTILQKQFFDGLPQKTAKDVHHACKKLDLNQTKELMNIFLNPDYHNFFVNSILLKSVREFITSREKTTDLIELTIYKDVIREITFEVATRVLEPMSSKEKLEKEQQRELYKILIGSLSNFTAQNFIQPSFLDPLVPHRSDLIFIKDLILIKKLMNPFIYFFTKKNITVNDETYTNEIIFSWQELQQFALYIYGNNFPLFSKFVKKLIYRIYKQAQNVLQEQKEEKYESYVREKMAIIVKGLIKHTEIVTPFINQTFPGYSAFFYLNYARRQRTKEMGELAAETTSPYSAYLLTLAVVDAERKKGKKVLDTSRLCYEMQMPNNDQNEFLEEIQAIASKLEVRKDYWESWSQSHPTISQVFEPKFKQSDQ